MTTPIRRHRFPFYLVLWVASITLFFYNVMDSNGDYFRMNSVLLGHVSSRIHSDVVCKIPQLLIDDPLIAPELETFEPLNCSRGKNWIYTVGDGRFYISEDAVRQFGKIECNYSRYDRISDWKYNEIDMGFLVNGTIFEGDTFRFICNAGNSTYDVLHSSVPTPNEELQERIQSHQDRLWNRSLDLNVMIYLLDSVSRVSFIRHCPKFYAFLIEKMGAYVMEGFNIVGDGTPMALIPMTTGHFQDELPEARRRFDNASHVDGWPLIFKNYMSAGYVTSYAEEYPSAGAFNYKLKGFNATPVDHYLRTLMLADRDRQTDDYDYCFGENPKTILFCKFWREMQLMYGPMGGRHLSIIMEEDFSHGSYNKVQMLDEHLVNYFGQLYEDGFFNDTLLMVMGDHGRRFGPVRRTQSGKLEEKLPLLTFAFPPWFKSRFPKSHANFLKNRHRLITAFDLHATLLDLLDFDEDGGVGNVRNRSISLFREIPAERTCAHAHIKPHFCSCLDWTDVEKPDKDPVVLQAAQEVIDYFNREINQFPGLCANLSLSKIMWARLLKPKDQLMAFKESIDTDNYYQDLTENVTLEVNIYEIRFITTPGDADFEATVSYFLKEKKFLMSTEDISRLDAYHKQALCVINSRTHGHLRTFCYCL